MECRQLQEQVSKLNDYVHRPGTQDKPPAVLIGKGHTIFFCSSDSAIFFIESPSL